MPNNLRYETSPYLLQHAENPVDWYPWGEKAFNKAKNEDKPVFLSIGYSTCHWCHVMAHESFENEEIADILNRYFVAVKVDKEERPDIDSVYMAVCQAFTGSGGWPTSVFMTAEQKPFFAGTYFPPNSLKELLELIHEKWETERPALLRQAGEIEEYLKKRVEPEASADAELIETAVSLYKRSYDGTHGGFGAAPKFPSPHNLLFLLAFYERCGDKSCLEMAEHTLLQMYRGGMFDHIGFGFCRYSTDARFLAPHFEKMLYDNALLIMAYCKAYSITKKEIYLMIAQRTAEFILREMTSPEGGFYSAQDADSEGEEGKYYLFDPDELVRVLGSGDGEAFCRRFDISRRGNFGGKSIPNLLSSDVNDRRFDEFLGKVYAYRRQRYTLGLDNKILTAWNSLMIAAMCSLYKASGEREYLRAAQRADEFIREKLYKNGTLFVSYRDGKAGAKGFLDDYADYIFAQISLYGATLEREYIDRAEKMCEKVISEFADRENGGFYLCGEENEKLISQPKETYDGAVPSGNSVMAWNFVYLSQLVSGDKYAPRAERQLDFISSDAQRYPAGYAMFLLALLNYTLPPASVTVVLAENEDREKVALSMPQDAAVTLLDKPTGQYPLKDGKTTFYVCCGHSCLPPVNDLSGIMPSLHASARL